MTIPIIAMMQITSDTLSIRPVLLLCSSFRWIERNCGEPMESSDAFDSPLAGVGRVRGVDTVSIMEVSLRNDDIPSTSPSDGSLLSSPKLFLSR